MKIGTYRIPYGIHYIHYSYALALLKNIRIGCKELEGTDAPAYLSGVTVMTKYDLLAYWYDTFYIVS